MKQILKENKHFYIPYFAFLVSSIILLIIYSKADIHLYINGLHSDFADFFFKYYTYAGDGVTALLLFFVLLFFNRKFALSFGIVNLIVGGIVQLLKNVFFNDMPRPKIYFESSAHDLFFVEGVRVHGLYSFPSGHTATAFATFLFLAFYTKNSYLKTAYFVAAFLAGYSRMYLSQHFLIDVVAGAVIGGVVGTVGYWVYKRKGTKRFPIASRC